MKKKGFTLVEMMAVVFISMIIFAAVFGLFLMGRNSWLVGKTYVELQQKTRTAMDKMVNELSQSASSQAVIVSCDGAECNGNKVIFKVPTITSAQVANTIFDELGNIKWGAEGYLAGEITYMALPNRNLIRRANFNPPAGACCLPDGKCVEVTQVNCNPLNGSYQGDGVLCAAVNCEQPPPPPPGCFLASTPILMADGKTLPIEKLKKGDEIMAFDEATKTLVKDKVKEFFVHTADNYLVINNHLRVTPNHPVYSQGKWVEIGKLKKGDSLFNSSGKAEIIKEIKPVHQKVKVYNIEVNPYHNYFAAGILAHNKEQEYMQGDWSKLFKGAFSVEDAFADQVDQVIATDIESITFSGLPQDITPQRITIQIRARKMTLIQRDVDITIFSSVQLRN